MNIAACTAGTYETNNKCKHCPLNTYQDEPRSIKCKECPSMKLTDMAGSFSSSDCSKYLVKFIKNHQIRVKKNQ